MSWQRWLRLAIAIGGLGTAVALFTLQRERPKNAPTQPLTAGDPAAQMQSGAGVDKRFADGAETGQWNLEYGATKTYEDGRVVREHIHMLFKDDGTEVWADNVEIKGRSGSTQVPAELVLTGNVKLKTPEGTWIQCDAAVYNDAKGFTNIPGKVAFARGRLSGTGIGGTYERATGQFRILTEAVMTASADNPGGVLNATSSAMTFNRADRTLQLDERARIEGESSVMTADRALLYMSDDEQQFKAVELRTKARVTPLPGRGGDVPDMQAQDIDLHFYEGSQTLKDALLTGKAVMLMGESPNRRSVEGGRIILMTGPDGKTVTRLESTDRAVVRTPATGDVPERVTSAASLLATGDEKVGLQQAIFAGRARFEETRPATGGKAASTRTGTSQTLTLKLKGQLDAIDEATFTQDVRFVDGEVTGTADVGVYHASKAQLDLQATARNSKGTPEVVNGSMVVDSTDLIRVSLDSQDLYARRDVRTSSKGDAKAAAKSSALFNSADTVFGSASEFRFEQARKITVYTGTTDSPARLRQGDDFVEGIEVIAHSDTQDIEARSKARTSFPVTDKSGSASAAPARYLGTAELFTYVDASRVARYSGSPAILRGPESDTEASTIVLTLGPDGRTLERLEATDNVYTRLSDDREALASSLLYEVAKARYTLSGRPVSLKAREKDNSCSISEGVLVNFNRVNGAWETEWPAAGGGSSTRGSNLPCSTTALRKAK